MDTILVGTATACGVLIHRPCFFFFLFIVYNTVNDNSTKIFCREQLSSRDNTVTGEDSEYLKLPQDFEHSVFGM